MSASQIVKWAAGFAVGVGAIIWLYATFLTKKEHEAYVTAHKEWEYEALNAIRGDMNELKVDAKELKEGHNIILRKLDSIDMRMNITKGKDNVNIKTNDIKSNISGKLRNPFE